MIDSFYFSLDGLIPKHTASDLFDLYTEGQCYELAVGFNDRYGWPVHILSSVNQTKYYQNVLHGPDAATCHVVAQAGPGLFVDISGGRTAELFMEEWSLPNFFQLRAKTPKGLARHFERLWDMGTEIHVGSTTASILDALHHQIPETWRVQV